MGNINYTIDDINRRLAILDYIIPGVGIPEGNIIAPIGTFFLRLDGGRGTSLYIKETGTGNTGWVPY